MKIIVAEDDAVSRALLREVVSSRGHESLEAEDGSAGWALFQEHADVDVVITDCRMPGMDGFELCRRIRGTEQGQGTYVILLTGLDEREHLLSGLEAGADDYLIKPLDTTELQVRLQSAQRLTALHRRLAAQNRELDQLNAELRDQSRKDPLTGLGNRLRLREDLDALLGRVARYGHDYCLVLCDVDAFKAYNDSYGHQAGDEVLRRVGETLAEQCRTGDSAYRYGGEEFLVVLPEQDLDGGRRTAERLRRAVEQLHIPHRHNPPSHRVTMSAGVASLRDVGAATGIDDLLGLADAALYRAKAAGRNRVIVHHHAETG